MSISFLAFTAISLFMIHEFDEIIFIRSWLKSEKSRSRPNLWTRGGSKSYPSTAVIAFEIAEEFTLIFLLCLLGIWLNLPGLLAGFIIANIIHLASHITDSLRAKFFTPGSPTALITFILNLTLLFKFFQAHPQPWGMIAFSSLISLIVFGVNLLLIHRLAKPLEYFVENIYQ
ncbi:HXXEE domain-containing protein [Lactococcus taiwanensis]|uniref:HXXEE domain-containing protein n=1 Tax=Lactococcus taiwanensis TaxID=1151742 RepID=UPI0019653A5D|nr:HXXEE domain-containing protein [Lactococcus taiwanensis]QRZ10806.1 HXXEE domain-containing protein [Lactococcus taiwanensis]